MLFDLFFVFFLVGLNVLLNRFLIVLEGLVVGVSFRVLLLVELDRKFEVEL